MSCPTNVSLSLPQISCKYETSLIPLSLSLVIRRTVAPPCLNKGNLPPLRSSLLLFCLGPNYTLQALHIRWPKYWSFSFTSSPSDEFSGLISFRIDWFDLFAIQANVNPLIAAESKYKCTPSEMQELTMRNPLPYRKMPSWKGRSLSKIAENGSLWSWDDSVSSWLASPLCGVFLGQDQVRSCPEWKRWVCCAWPGHLEGEEDSGSAGKLSGPGRMEGDSWEPRHAALSPKAGTEWRMGRCDDQQSTEYCSEGRWECSGQSAVRPGGKKSLTGRSVSVEQGERRGDKLDLEELPQRALETIKDKQVLPPWRSGLNFFSI